MRNAPNAPVVLNNLALALCRVSPENAQRSRELIDRALRISGPNAEILDTQGEIRMASGDYVGAVESFESAVGLDGKRIATRRRLMAAYEKAGMKDMVPVQENKIRELEATMQPIPTTTEPPVSDAIATPEEKPQDQPDVTQVEKQDAVQSEEQTKSGIEPRDENAQAQGDAANSKL